MTRYIEGALDPEGTPMTTSSGDEITLAIGQWADVTSGHRHVCKVRRGFGNDFTRGRHYLRLGVRELRVPRWLWDRF